MLPAILKLMIRGGYHKAADGFTIVEVMIVLAVSGLLLASAALLIDGRQARTEFTTAINYEQQRIQQIINETASGYYPNGNDFTCNANPAGAVLFSKVASAQGTNGGCIFLGKAVQFGINTISPGSGTLGVIPIVGNQYQGGTSTPVLNVSQSVPRALYPVNAGELANVPTDAVVGDVMEYGLHMATGNSACTGVTTAAVCYVPFGGGSFLQTGIAAFVSGDDQGGITATASGSSTNLQSGTQQLSLYAVKGSKAGDGWQQASTNISNLSSLPTQGLDSAKEVLICIASGGTNQSGLFTIGGTGTAAGNGGLNVTLQIMGDSTC
jgi:prepilin-type N-terminal cleavage/methylation domain-containing protein